MFGGLKISGSEKSILVDPGDGFAMDNGESSYPKVSTDPYFARLQRKKGSKAYNFRKYRLYFRIFCYIAKINTFNFENKSNLYFIFAYAAWVSMLFLNSFGSD